MAIYYMGDPHFFHEAALSTIRIGHFGYDVTTMNRIIVENYNERVEEEDTVYFMGDIIFSKAEDLEVSLLETLGKMKGHKVLIVGNHDYKNLNKTCFRQYFEEIREQKIIVDGERHIHLNHYPLAIFWNQHRDGFYHIFGHTHGETVSEAYEYLRLQEKSLCCCVDITEFKPATFNELIQFNHEWKRWNS